jgi:hypothetical protein
MFQSLHGTRQGWDAGDRKKATDTEKYRVPLVSRLVQHQKLELLKKDALALAAAEAL